MGDNTDEEFFLKIKCFPEDYYRVLKSLRKNKLSYDSIEKLEMDNLYQLKSRYEKELERKKAYRNRPDVKERRKEYYSRPEVITKRTEYFSKPEIKEKLLQKQKNKREMLKAILRENPSLAKKYKQKYNLDRKSEFKNEFDNNNNSSNNITQSESHS